MKVFKGFLVVVISLFLAPNVFSQDLNCDGTTKCIEVALARLIAAEEAFEARAEELEGRLNNSLVILDDQKEEELIDVKAQNDLKQTINLEDPALVFLLARGRIRAVNEDKTRSGIIVSARINNGSCSQDRIIREDVSNSTFVADAVCFRVLNAGEHDLIARVSAEFFDSANYESGEITLTWVVLDLSR